MKIHLIKKQSLLLFANNHARSRSSIALWMSKVRFADWSKPVDMKRTFGQADLLGKSSQRVVFDLGGNEYRLICKYHFGEKYLHLFVCWIGTHAEYMSLCQMQKQYSINVF